MLQIEMNNMTKETNWKEKLYRFFYKNSKITRPVKLFKVDFNKPWWHAFEEVKYEIGGTMVWVVLRYSLFALCPLIVGYIFSSKEYNLFYYFFGYWIFLEIAIYFYNPIWIRIYSKVLASVKFAAQNFFLTTDPVHHSTRSSGQIISKVARGKQAYDDVISIFTEDLFPMIVTLLTAATTLFFVDLRIGFIGLVFYAITTLVSSWLLILTTQIIEPRMIAADDLEKQVEVENLAQVALIRSTFATQIQIDKSEVTMQKSFANWNLKWKLQHIIRQIVTYPFIAFNVFCIYYIVTKIDSGNISQSLGASIIVTVILNTGQILWINQKIERLIKATIEADDLFKFIRGFGKRTFPVLKE